MSLSQPDNTSVPPPVEVAPEPLRLTDVVGATALITVAAIGVAVAFALAAAGTYAAEKLGRIRKILHRNGGRHVQ